MLLNISFKIHVFASSILQSEIFEPTSGKGVTNIFLSKNKVIGKVWEIYDYIDWCFIKVLYFL